MSFIFHNHIYRRIFWGALLSTVILLFGLKMTEKLHPVRYSYGPSFKEAMLSESIKEIMFSFDKDIIDFSSYEESVTKWQTLLNPQINNQTIPGSIRTISGKKFALVLDSPILPTDTVSISYNTNIRSLNNEPVRIFINHTETKNSPFTIDKKSCDLSHIYRESNNLYDPIKLHFNYPISRRKLKQRLSLIDSSSKKQFYHLSYEIETNNSGAIPTIVTNYQKILLHPLFLKKHLKYTLLLDNTGIDAQYKNDIYHFETYQIPTWKGFTQKEQIFFHPQNTNSIENNIFYVGDDIWLLNSNRLKSINNNSSVLYSDPSIENLSYVVKPEGIKISGSFDKEGEYLLRFQPHKIKDEYNQEITKDYSEKIIIKNRVSDLKIMEHFLILHEDKPLIPIQMMNVKKIQVSYQIINSAYYMILAFNNHSVPLPFVHKDIEIDAPINSPFWYNLDISSLISSYKNMLVILKIKNADDPNAPMQTTRVFVTKNALFAHMSINDILFQARSFKTDSPIEDMMISIWDPVRGSFHDLGRTTSEGFLRVPNPKLPMKALVDPLIIGMTEDTDHNISFICGGISQFKSLDKGIFQGTSEIIHNNIEISQAVTSMFFTDRPVYRPGESIYIHAIARTKKNSKFSSDSPFFKTPVQISIFSPSQNKLTNFTQSWSDMGSIGVNFPTKITSELGLYTVKIENKPFKFFEQTNFHLEHFMEKQSELLITSSKDTYFYGDTLKLLFQPQFLSGDPIETTIRYSITKKPYLFISKVFPNYTFHDDENSIPYFTKHKIVPSKKRKFLSAVHYLQQQKRNNVELTVKATGKIDKLIPFSSQEKNLRIFTHSQLGIKSSRSIMNTGDTAHFELIAIDPVTEIIRTDIPAEFSIYAKKKINLGFLDKFSLSLNIKKYFKLKVFEKKILLGKKEINFIPKEPGEYIVELLSMQKNNKIRTRTYFSVLDKDTPLKDNQTLVITANKSLYHSGDTVKLSIENPFPYSSALIMVERDTIREYYSVKSANKIIKHNIPLTADDEPGISVSVFMSSLSTKNAEINPAPAFRFGVHSISITPKHKTLSVQIDSPTVNYLPRDRVELEITALSPDNLQIDGEALIIVRNRSSFDPNTDSIPDPIQHYYSYRPRGFSSWDSGVLLECMNNFKDHIDKIMPMAQYVRTLNRNPAKEEHPVLRSKMKETICVERIPLFNHTKSAISFTLPDNITGFEIHVLAYDKDECFGQKKSYFTTSKPLMVDPIIPDFVRPNDKIIWGASIRNFSEETLDVNVKLNNELEEISTNITINNNSSMNIFHEFSKIPKKLSNQNYWWQVSATSEELSDGISKEIPLVYKNPPLVSSYSGLIKGSTILNVIPEDSAADSPQTINISASTAPFIKIMETLENIILNQSLYLPLIIDRIKIISEYMPILLEYNICGLDKKSLLKILETDLEHVKDYKIENNKIATTPSSLFTVHSPLLILRLYDALLSAQKNNLFIDKDLLSKLSQFAQNTIKDKKSNSSDKYILAYAYKLLAIDKLIDKDNFRVSYPTIPQNLESQALILDTMHLLGFSLGIIANQTSMIIQKTTETGSDIMIPQNSEIVAQTLIRHYGSFEDAYKIINALSQRSKDLCETILLFSTKYPENSFIYPIHIKTSKQDFTLTQDLPFASFEIDPKENPTKIELTTKNSLAFFHMNHLYSINPEKKIRNVGYKIEKKLLSSENKSIGENTLERGKEYIVEITVTPNANAPQNIEIIDPLYGGITPLTKHKQKDLLKSTSMQRYPDRIHLYAKIPNKQPFKIRYAIQAKIPGVWTAPMIFAYKIGSSDTFGYSLQSPIKIVENN